MFSLAQLQVKGTKAAPPSEQACFSSALPSQQEPASLPGLYYPHCCVGPDRNRTEMSPVQEDHSPSMSLFSLKRRTSADCRETACFSSCGQH